MFDALHQRGRDAWRWMRRNPVPSAVAALIIAGASATAAVSASGSAYTGCGYGYAGSTSTYAAGYGNCPAVSPVVSATTTSTTVTTTSSAPPPASGAAGVTATVVGGQSTTVTITSPIGSARVTIQAGALPPGTTVVVSPVGDTSGLVPTVLAGSHDAYVAAFSITWQTPSGTSPPAAAPITLTITSPEIKAGDVVYAIVNGKLLRVGIATSDGAVTVTFTNDPIFVVAAPPALGLARPGATLVGKTISARFRCLQGSSCVGTATLNVARGPQGSRHQVFVARARFSLMAGQLGTVRFAETAFGLPLFAAHAAHVGRFYVGYVLHVTGGARRVGRLFVH